MGFPARSEGICIKCQRSISIGEMITWNRIEKSKIWHIDCDGEKKSVAFPTVPPIAHGDTVGHYENGKSSPTPIVAVIPPAPVVSVIVEEPAAPAVVSSKDPMRVFIDALLPHIEKRVKGKVDEARVKELIAQNLPKPDRIEVSNLSTGTMVSINNPHEKFKDVLFYVSIRKHIYLWGPAGSGKSTIAHQVSEALSLPWGFLSLNPQTPDSRLMGYMDAQGVYRATPFYECYVNGGVFCIDEMDNASAALLTTLNSLLANGHGAFPDGVHKRHPEFVLIATGNTNGRGANQAYPERRALDSAFLDRFFVMPMGYDEKMELAAALAINPDAQAWVEWVQSVRVYCKEHHPKVIVTPRASIEGSMILKHGRPAGEVLEGLIFKGLASDTLESILTHNPIDSWAAAKQPGEVKP